MGVIQEKIKGLVLSIDKIGLMCYNSSVERRKAQ